MNSDEFVGAPTTPAVRQAVPVQKPSVPVPTHTVRPPGSAKPKSSGGGFLGAIGHFFGSVGRGIATAVTTATRWASQGSQYAGGFFKGIFTGALTGLGINIPGITPAKYPTTPKEIAADSSRIKQRFGQAIQSLPAAPRQMLDDMRALGVSDTDIFHGSHVVVEDGGRLCDKWRQLPGARERTSSHYDGKNQYEMNFPGIGVVLFGKTPDGQTFFQMEAHSNQDLVNHTSDYFVHLLSGHQNVGPAGLSPHSEKEGREIRIPGS